MVDVVICFAWRWRLYSRQLLGAVRIDSKRLIGFAELLILAPCSRNMDPSIYHDCDIATHVKANDGEMWPSHDECEGIRKVYKYIMYLVGFVAEIAQIAIIQLHIITVPNDLT